ncbi:hypothetical protein MY11210_004601 [Beauveria gryllotalpidicola]
MSIAAPPLRSKGIPEPHLFLFTVFNRFITVNAAGITIRAPCGHLADRSLASLDCLVPWPFYRRHGPLCRQQFPHLTDDLDEIGTRVGTIPTVKSLDPLTGPSVAGALIARGGGNCLAA